MVGNPYYGAMGEVSAPQVAVLIPVRNETLKHFLSLSLVQVQDSSDVISEGRVRVVFTVPCEPHLDALIQNQHVSLPSIFYYHIFMI